jgi:hypothetical protein
MTDYLVLVRLSPSKMQEAIGAVRNLPEKPISGVDLCYTMNIFGSWDVGVWIDAENSDEAIDFVQRRIKGIAGVSDVHALPTFPHGNKSSKTEG